MFKLFMYFLFFWITNGFLTVQIHNFGFNYINIVETNYNIS